MTRGPELPSYNGEGVYLQGEFHLYYLAYCGWAAGWPPFVHVCRRGITHADRWIASCSMELLGPDVFVLFLSFCVRADMLA